MSVTTLKLGKDSTIQLDTGSNNGAYSSSATIGGQISGTFTFTRENVDATNNDGAGYKGTEYGTMSGTLSVEVHDDQVNDTAQDQLLADMYAGTKRWMRVRARVGTGYIQYSAKFVINSAAHSMAVNDVVKFTLDAVTDGTITKSDQ